MLVTKATRTTAVALLSLLAAVLSAGDVHAQSFANFGQPCAPFSCASGRQAPAPKKDFVFSANGCGTAMLPISSDVDFADCCNWHDACYSTCGMKKATCEKRLDRCMKDKCAQLEDADEKDKCTSTAKLFSLGAQMIACPAFQDAQREACVCVSKDAAQAANRERLVHFLAVNDAPVQEREDAAVDALLAKYAGQEPKMFQRLLLKYPQALKLDAKKRNFMEDIFKAGGGGGGAGGAPSFEDTKQKMRNQKKTKKKAPVEDDRVDEHIEL